MTTESMRAEFEAWYDAFEFRRAFNKYGPSGAAFEVWQAATLRERERCAKVCEDAADKLELGKKRVPQADVHTAYVLRSKAEAIRKGQP